VSAGVVLYFAVIGGIYAVIWRASYDGTVRSGAPVYAAIDEPSLLKLEKAELQSEDLATLAAAGNRHIIRIAAGTPVRYEKRSFYERDTLSPTPSPSARSVLFVKVLGGPEKKRRLWIDERSVGFYNAP
jgi:hypothetical protein